MDADLIEVAPLLHGCCELHLVVVHQNLVCDDNQRLPLRHVPPALAHCPWADGGADAYGHARLADL